MFQQLSFDSWFSDDEWFEIYRRCESAARPTSMALREWRCYSDVACLLFGPLLLFKSHRRLLALRFTCSDVRSCQRCMHEASHLTWPTLTALD